MVRSKQGKLLNITMQLSVLLLVVIWVVPTFGLLVSSLRDKNQISVNGWWKALTTTEQSLIARTDDLDKQQVIDDKYVLKGKIETTHPISAFGVRSQEPKAFQAGQTADLGNNQSMTVNADGSYSLSSPTAFEAGRGKRIFYTTEVPPRFTLDNYREVLSAQGLGRSFINSLTVAIPSTIIPILVAAYAAYALAWMRFPGRSLIIAMVVGLLVVPLQMSLIPLLRLYNEVGLAKTYLGVWLAHMGFGLPLAIYLLRNYIVGLPKEIMESARVDGATHFNIFQRIVLPLSFPALASFAIFQFLWTWNDLLVAIVFLSSSDDQLVLTARLRAMLGTLGGNWEILTASAFVTIFVPLMVFFGLQRYLVRGMLAGSVK
ncbi:carbohydrate ABC transporter permease [Thiolinea disciformis]|uniref:carbohydrate ABC transporter permease n=1 Tax=Thiolinea disciformis TaxID=125614 RepID=UPI000369905C|nr:carbohydrate ABC transporter permease [Thiolinea disciformis]